MRITIEAGTRGWFEVQFNGLDSVTFKRDTTVELERWGMPAVVGDDQRLRRAQPIRQLGANGAQHRVEPRRAEFTERPFRMLRQ